MANKEQVYQIIEKLKIIRPTEMFKDIDCTNKGMRFILIYISENNNVYASTISEKMNISRARVGILLKKLENKKFITKRPSSSDARIDVIELTPPGRSEAEKLKEDAISEMIKIIDYVGFDELNTCLDTMAKVKKILENWF